LTRLQKMMSQEETPVIVVDQDGAIRYVNTAFETAFHWDSTDLTGKMLTVLIPETVRDAHHMGFSRFLMTGNPTILGQSLDLNILTGDGEVTPARHFIIAEKRNGEWVFAAEIRKIAKVP